jgi:hypothetical protein
LKQVLERVFVYGNCVKQQDTARTTSLYYQQDLLA